MTRPANVVRYERLMILAAALGVTASVILRGAEMVATEGVVGTVAIHTASVAFFLMWVALVSRGGRNWARWLSAGVLLLSGPGVAGEIIETYGAAPVASMMIAAAYLIQLVACYFVFTGDARTWFTPEPLVMPLLKPSKGEASNGKS